MGESAVQNCEKWIREAIKHENFINYRLNIKGITEKGEGFVCGVTFVQILATKQDGENVEYNFVVKHGDRVDTNQFKCIQNACKQEMHFYNEIFPYFTKFQEQKGLKAPFDSVPSCYKALIDENNVVVLILDDLRKAGYELHGYKKPMNYDHLKLVFESYAKYHAISFALKDQQPEKFHEFTKDFGTTVSEAYKQLTLPKLFRSQHATNLKFLAELGESQLSARYKPFDDEIDNVFIHNRYDLDPYVVITHGDAWCNNILFKYKDGTRETPESVCIIDWQLIKLASPICDLTYFFYTAVSEDEFGCYENLLNEYYDVLSETIKKLGSDPEKLFPKSEIKEHWRKYAKYGLILAPAIYNLSLTKKNEVSEITSEKRTSGTLGTKTGEAKQIYLKKFVSLLRHMVDINVI